MLWSRGIYNIITKEKVEYVKIYNYDGKKNLCGNRIREARMLKRMSQSDLAAKMQTEGIILERDSISRIEIGTRFVADYELMIFARVLKVNVEWLLATS